jgi:hypothetical protein
MPNEEEMVDGERGERRRRKRGSGDRISCTSPIEEDRGGWKRRGGTRRTIRGDPGQICESGPAQV